MTDSRNVVHSLERASHVHSDHIIEKRMKIQTLQEIFSKNREKDSYFEPDGQKDNMKTPVCKSG